MPAQLGTLVVPVLAAAPAVGAEGALYFNSTSNTLFASDTVSWNTVGGSGGVQVSDTAPGSPTAGMLWWKSDTGKMYVYYDSFWIGISGGADGATGATGAAGNSMIPFNQPGTLIVRAGTSSFPFPVAATIKGVSARVGTAPTGAAILVDVNKNGTTIFTTQGNRPTIAISGFATASEVTNMDVTAFAAGDYLSVDVDQVGSTIAGANLTVIVRYTVP